MIEDAELRELFQSESEEHLQSLDDGLLRLESNPQDSATLEEVFRAAHSLKGTARMLGVTGVETVAHHLEDELGNAKRGRSVLSTAVIDRLCASLDAIRKLVGEAVTGVPAAVDVNRVLSQLNGTAPIEKSSTSSQDIAEGEIVAPHEVLLSNEHGDANVIPPPTVSQPPYFESPAASNSGLDALISSANSTFDQQMEVAPANEKTDAEPDGQAMTMAERTDFKIQTMRVPPAKLDALMTLASELTVTTNRLERGLATFVEVSELWEEWNKDLFHQRPVFKALQSTHALTHANTKKLAAFHEREQERLAQLSVLVDRFRQTVYDDVTRLGLVADGLEESIRNVRLLPLSTIFNLFPRSVRDLARDQHKEVQIILEGGDTTADKRILEELKDPLMHMLRNAIDHGIEPAEERERVRKPRMATVRLRAYQTAVNVVVELQDDGRGIDVAAIKRTAIQRRLHNEEELQAMSVEQIQMLIFAPGFSTSPIVTDVSGRGVGLDVVRANVENLKGSIHVHSVRGVGSTFTIRLPLTIATTRVLLVEVESRPYAIPIEFVQGIVRVSSSQFFAIEGRETLVLNDEPIPIARLSQVLELETGTSGRTSTSQPDVPQVCVIVTVGSEKAGLLVDTLIDEQEVVLKPLGPMLRRVRNVSGATILGAGEVCMVLNPNDLVKSAQRVRPALAPAIETADEDTAQRRKVILLAEDSITTRTQEKRILESAGYEVVTAVDGADAFGKLPTREFDAVVSDVQMPNMDGLTLCARIREDKRHRELPIILVTSLASDDDKRRGVEVGASAYITKGSFEQKVLLDVLRRLA